MIQQALRDHLANDPSVSALVGDRIGPNRAATSRELEYITYQIISHVRSYVLSGPSRHVTATIQINCFSVKPVTCATLANTVRLSLDGFYGAFGTHSVNVKEITVEGPITDFDEPVDGDEAGTFRLILEARIGYLEDVGAARRMQKVG